MYIKYGDNYAWSAFQGPQGIAVNPCGDRRFKTFAYRVPERHPGKSIEEVPYPRKGMKWPLKLDGQTDCQYESEENGPGAMKCGNYMVVPLRADWQKNTKTIKCKIEGFEAHRAWSEEF
ncbi:hypothetical protein FB567DRAFT_449112 [Paraphoma chrysanthemicola]|uniref:Uncharacterized protein n=1 Tax=Paraphoma chrysanthemicola TaxID=798071 RepID=A0A8K0R1A0_9PLEO|nr:hypothetical protein FB567DRAFT_449112 [Paraphoma chrysanthemicola]